MSSTSETTKYIERLVRIITQKEKVIDQLRKTAKQTHNTNGDPADDQTSIAGRKVRQDLNINHLQIKSLQQKMYAMEERLLDFSQGLKEQSQINQQLRLQIQNYERRQQELSEQIVALSDMNNKLEEKVAEMEVERAQEMAIKGRLQLEVKQLSKKLRKYEAIEQFEVKQSTKQLRKIHDKVKNLYRVVTQTPYTQIKQQESKRQNQSKGILKMIEIIEQKMKKQNEYPREDVLNDTLDGISIIVRSLECGHSVTEHNRIKNCSYEPLTLLKNEASVSQAAKEFKNQNLKKSKLESTRLNCTAKILQDLLSE